MQDNNDYNVNRIRVTHVAMLNTDDYEHFVTHLLDSQKWLSGKGGANSTTEGLPEVKYFYELTDEQQKLWHNGMYIECIAVSAPGKHTIYIDKELLEQDIMNFELAKETKHSLVNIGKKAFEKYYSIITGQEQPDQEPEQLDQLPSDSNN